MGIMRTVRESARAIAVLAGLAMVAVMFFVAVPPTLADNHNSNDPAFWGEDCWKDDNPAPELSYTATQDYRLVVLKAATENFVFENVKAGDVLEVGNERAISHIIFCEGSDSSTTTTQPTTTSTTTTSTTSTTTTAPSTTTTEPPSSSTTTTTEQSTTTTEPRERRTTTTTSTSIPFDSTTTSVPETTTTDEGAIVTVATLPYTGMREFNLIAGGLLVLGAGGVLLVLTWRSREE